MFFEEYNAEVKNLTKEYENDMGVLYINVGILDEAEYDDMMKIAGKNNVDELPSILLLDSKGEYVDVVAGKFKKEDMIKKIHAIIK